MIEKCALAYKSKMRDYCLYVASAPIRLKLFGLLRKVRESHIFNIYKWLWNYLQNCKKSCNIITVGENTPLVKLQGGNNASEAT